MTNCYYHSKKEAVHHCRYCHRDICQSCSIEVEGEPFCQICWDGAIAHVRNAQPAREESPREIPWQRWRELGPVKAFFETAGQVAFQPAYFFSHLPVGRQMASPLLFAVICILLFWFPMNVLYIKYIFPPLLNGLSTQQQVSDNSSTQPPLSEDSSEAGQAPAVMQQELRQRILSISGVDILTMPVNFILFNVFVASMLQQFMVQMFRGREGFVATFQIRCYAMIAQCLLLVPVVGILLAEIGSLFVCLRGFQVVQKLTFAQALCVALVPIMISFLALPALI